ncbi:DUF6522 family protein [Tropicimonas sp. IMCC6043]|uniref:DUF6522 family protein n=1 Tax=Tropicimonas sp. IMCC6043 TaxID=2510645 RepID=UPI00101BE3B8|nr:DUF6522 family protein [Tropicimonas sp. IMCC6043]RYH06442.1 hypothetical protein EU800_23810 [Tropicimonas sp. IMCC6043]
MELEPTDNGFAIAPTDLGRLFDRDPDEMRQMMQDGSMTCLVERGEGDDAGRFRVTLRDDIRRVRLVVDADGKVLTTVRVPFVAQKGAPGPR